MLSRLTYITLRWIIRLAPVAVLLWVLTQNASPFGSTILRCSPKHCDSRITAFAPRETDLTLRTPKNSDQEYRVISADPLYVEVEAFRPMQRATVSLTYQNPDNQPALRLGVLKGNTYEFTPFPIVSPVQTELEQTWDVQRDGVFTLYTRAEDHVHHYDDVQSYLDSDQMDRRSVTFNLTPDDVPLKKYQPLPASRPLPFGLRGSQTILAYVGTGEPLDMQFTLRDANLQRGADTATVRVMRGPYVVWSTVVKDDGIEDNSRKVSVERPVHIHVPETIAGTYRIQIDVKGNDIFLQNLTSAQRFVSFNHSVYLAMSKNYQALGPTTDRPVTVYFRGTELRAITANPEGLQTIRAGTKRLTVSKVNTHFNVKLSNAPAVVPITLTTPDIILEGDGVFAFSPSDLAEPADIGTLNSRSSLSDFDYVIARTPTTETLGLNEKTSRTVEVPVQRKLQFLISGVPSYSAAGKELLLKNLTIKLEGERLTPNVLMRLARKLFQKTRAAEQP